VAPVNQNKQKYKVLNKKILKTAKLMEVAEFQEFYSCIFRTLENFKSLEKIFLEILVMWEISFFHCLFLGNWRKQFSKFLEFPEFAGFALFTEYTEFTEFTEFGE
jgi:hypothetical protein